MSGQLTLDLSASGITADYNVIVTDIAGKQLMHYSQLTGSKQLIDMDNLSPGLYFVNLQAEGSSFTKKIIKQ